MKTFVHYQIGFQYLDSTFIIWCILPLEMGRKFNNIYFSLIMFRYQNTIILHIYFCPHCCFLLSFSFFHPVSLKPTRNEPSWSSFTPKWTAFLGEPSLQRVTTQAPPLSWPQPAVCCSDWSADSREELQHAWLVASEFSSHVTSSTTTCMIAIGWPSSHHNTLPKAYNRWGTFLCSVNILFRGTLR